LILGLPSWSASPPWQRVEFLSDVHLHADEPETAHAWMQAVRQSQADALFILGDLFEVWVGDDDDSAFVTQCIDALAHVAQHRAVFFMHGNRDFLAGASLMQRTGMQALPDPCVLPLGRTRCVLTHGDQLCLEDTDYLAFRAQVRSPAWQAEFLARPLDERRALARQMRAQSESRKQTQTHYADVDAHMAREWLDEADAHVLIHGHTHRPGQQALGSAAAPPASPKLRWCLSDWDATAQPRRVEMTVWQRQDQDNGQFGLTRVVSA
jgi:UDP-2,3-diacylglucosamine hydrolase